MGEGVGVGYAVVGVEEAADPEEGVDVCASDEGGGWFEGGDWGAVVEGTGG